MKKIIYFTLLVLIATLDINGKENTIIQIIEVTEEIEVIFNEYIKGSLTSRLETDGQFPYSFKYEKHELYVNNENLTFYKIIQDYREQMYIITFESNALFEFNVYVCIIVLDNNNNLLSLNIIKIRKNNYNVEDNSMPFPFFIQDNSSGTE